MIATFSPDHLHDRVGVSVTSRNRVDAADAAKIVLIQKIASPS
jgi:hypothetical protein